MNQTDIQKPLFPKGDAAPASYFTGAAWVNGLVSAEDNYRMVIGSVDFAPGARNHWHTIPEDKFLSSPKEPGITRKRISRSANCIKEM